MFPVLSDTTIPSLTFTKAELVYALSVLMPDIPANDNHTLLELVELRFYLNRIKEKVAQAASNGMLERAMPLPDNEVCKDTPPEPKAAPMPTMSELRTRFPTLSEEEIQEVLEKAKENSINGKEVSNKNPIHLTPTYSFIVKPRNDEKSESSPILLTKQDIKNREQAKKFSQLLGH